MARCGRILDQTLAAHAQNGSIETPLPRHSANFAQAVSVLGSPHAEQQGQIQGRRFKQKMLCRVDVMRKDVERDSGPIMKKFAANQILLV
jgi:hypothetical protein